MTINKEEWIFSLDKELERLLEFWMTRAVDKENGGFHGAVDHLGLEIKGAGKGAILNARILWSFSASYRHTGNKSYMKMAERAFHFFVGNFIDEEYGGVYWELDANGNVRNDRKQAYALGFAIYGLTEYYLACKDEKGLKLALQLFDTIEKNFWDREHEGYIEAFTRDYKMLDDWRLSLKDANEPKSMNTHLHILEPYTNLYRCIQDPELKKCICRLIDLFLYKILNTQNYHLNLFFDMKWQIKSEIISYGHDIEAAWLLQEAAEVIDDQSRIVKTKEAARKIADVTMKEGFAADGSLFYEKKVTELDEDRHWWPQAEAMVGFLNAWQNTEEKHYLGLAYRLWEYIEQCLLNKKTGEWYGRVNSEGDPYADNLADFWKCPYHNTRALIEASNRLKLTSSGNKNES